MTHKTVLLSHFDCYIASGEDTQVDQSEQRTLRVRRLVQFPYAAMLQVSFPELDFTNRWCWQTFGSRNGVCMQMHSQYRVCEIDAPHAHSGIWTDHWFTKTDYDFGFNEWYFVNESDYCRFVENVPNINWGENYPK